MSTNPNLSSTFRAAAKAARKPVVAVLVMGASWAELALIAAGAVGVVLALEWAAR